MHYVKTKVHDLIKAEALAFNDDDIPDVNRNPLPDHQRLKINAIGSDLELQIEKDAKAVLMPMKTVYEALIKTETLDEEQEKKKMKMGKDSIASITRSPWATPFKTVKIF